ncbi:MAG: branched-chain-amino-acid transaminase [Acidobacteria bacterium]|nr:branched-chain-amino-acid transaminase [Acidobacteriota bacterium]
MEPRIYVDGAFYDRRGATISVFDHGLLYGDGVFEGLRAYNGRVFELEAHIARLFASAKAICLELRHTRDEMAEIVLETCRQNHIVDGYVRLVVTRGVGDLGVDPRRCLGGPSVVAIAVPTLHVFGEGRPRGLRLVTAVHRRVAHDALNPSVKSLNYLNSVMAKIEANQRGADEALMLDSQGYVSEATVDNIFVLHGRRLMTPWTSTNLDGITRRTVIGLAPGLGLTVEQRPLALYDVWSADEVVITGTAVEVQPVVEVDGRTIGTGAVGPIAGRVIEAYAAHVRSHGTPIPTGTVMGASAAAPATT